MTEYKKIVKWSCDERFISDLGREIFMPIAKVIQYLFILVISPFAFLVWLNTIKRKVTWRKVR